MKTNTSKLIFKAALFLFLGLFGTLMIHLYFVGKHKANQQVYAMGRIDFNESLSEASFLSIQNFTVNLRGVKNAMVNPKQKVLVFIYQPKVQSIDEIKEKIDFFSNQTSKVYRTNAKAMGQGCPVGLTDNGTSKKYLSYFFSPILILLD